MLLYNVFEKEVSVLNRKDILSLEFSKGNQRKGYTEDLECDKVIETIFLSKRDRGFGGSTSKGNQQKWFSDGYWIKADFLGYEGLAEELSSILLSCTNIENYCPYVSCQIYEGRLNRGLGCSSPSFIGSQKEYITFYSLFTTLGYDLDSLLEDKSTLDKFETFTKIVYECTAVDVTFDIIGVLSIDAIILNEDRHFNNLGLIRDSLTGEYSFAPVFDNGLSLLSDINDYPLSEPVRVNIREVKAKPFTTDFNKQVNLIQTITSNKPVLKVDMNKLENELQNYNSEYDKAYVDRALHVLKSRLFQLEDKVWERV